MKQHFVTFFSPGTFFDEQSSKPIDSWDVETAQRMACDIVERYGATPYGFCFTTRARGDSDLDSKEISRSNMYHLGGEVLDAEGVKHKLSGDNRILLENMRMNGWKSVVVNDNSWRHIAPLRDGDTVLVWKPKARGEAKS